MRPVKFKSQIFEDIYSNVFAPPYSAMSRIDFKEFTELGFIRELRKGSSYADVGSKSSSLSVLVSGSIEVLNFRDNKELKIGVIKPFDIVDSPQWFINSRRNSGIAKDDFKVKEEDFLVKLRALEDCVYVMWPIESCDSFIKSKPYFKSYLDGVIGCDVAKKLFQLDKTLATVPSIELAVAEKRLDKSISTDNLESHVNNSDSNIRGADGCAIFDDKGLTSSSEGSAEVHINTL